MTETVTPSPQNIALFRSEHHEYPFGQTERQKSIAMIDTFKLPKDSLNLVRAMMNHQDEPIRVHVLKPFRYSHWPFETIANQFGNFPELGDFFRSIIPTDVTLQPTEVIVLAFTHSKDDNPTCIYPDSYILCLEWSSEGLEKTELHRCHCFVGFGEMNVTLLTESSGMGIEGVQQQITRPELGQNQYESLKRLLGLVTDRNSLISTVYQLQTLLKESNLHEIFMLLLNNTVLVDAISQSSYLYDPKHEFCGDD